MDDGSNLVFAGEHGVVDLRPDPAPLDPVDHLIPRFKPALGPNLYYRNGRFYLNFCDHNNVLRAMILDELRVSTLQQTIGQAFKDLGEERAARAVETPPR